MATYKPQRKHVDGTMEDVKIPYSSIDNTPDLSVYGQKTDSVFFAVGTSSQAGNASSGSYLSTRWEASIPGITTPYNGMKIAYRVPDNTGVSTAGAILSIDYDSQTGTGTYYPVLYNKTSIISSRYASGSTIWIVFNSSVSGAYGYETKNVKKAFGACWQIMDYDSTTTKSRFYATKGSATVNYPIACRYSVTAKTVDKTDSSGYIEEYDRYSPDVTLDPFTGTIKALAFTENGTALSSKYYLASNPSGYTTNTGTVTSVGGGTGLSITGTASVNPTINIASGYKLPTTTEWGNKQDTLATQTAYSAKGSATKVPQITTNSLGQVTSITEVTITQPSAGSSATAISTTASGGSATTWSKSDHVHNIALATGDSNGQVKIAGTNISVKGLAAHAYYADDATHRVVTDTEKATWNAKQDALTTQTAYTSKGSATKVPQITTNTLGQVTGITEVTITQPTVNNPTISIKQGATIKGSFTLNQSGNQTIQIDAGTGGASNWGDIGGTLSNQTDLQDALDLKGNLRTSLQSVPYGTAVPADIDLNTLPYIRVGNYYCSQNATAATQTNCPTSLAYMMVVYSPLSVDNIDQEETRTWVYRTRLLRDLAGYEYYQLVQSGSTAGSFSYGPWIRTARTGDISNATITINQGSTTKGTFSLNGSATTITVDPIPSNLAYTNVDNNFSVKQTVSGGMKVTGRYQSSGDDEGLIVGLANNNYAGVILGDPSGERVVLYNNAGSHTAMVRHHNGTSKYDMKFPDVSGDIVVLSSADYTKLKALLNQIQANPSSSGVTFTAQVNAPTFNGTT